MAKYLLDSMILIDHLNGASQATTWLADLKPDEALISVITRAEVLVGCGDQWETVAAFLEEYTCLGIGADEADMAAALRNKYQIKLPDAFQAALASHQDLTLVTRDHDGFKKIEGLEIKIPYKLHP